MKKLMVFGAVFFFATNEGLYAQTHNDSLSHLSKYQLGTYYAKKARQQKTTGLVLTGAGLIMTVTGFVIASNTHIDFSPNPPNSDAGAAFLLVLAGLPSAISGSIILISSGVNKRKARLFLQNQTTFITPVFYRKQTAFGIAIPLGR